MNPVGSSLSEAVVAKDAMTWGSMCVAWVTDGYGFLRTLLMALSYALYDTESPDALPAAFTGAGTGTANYIAGMTVAGVATAPKLASEVKAYG